MPARVTHGALVVNIGTRLRLLAVELLSTIEPLCPSQYLFGTILVTQYLMVWDWRLLRAEPMLSCWPNLLFLFVSYNFFFFFFHGFVVYGWEVCMSLCLRATEWG